MAQIECIRGAYQESGDFFGTEDLWSASSYVVKDGHSLYIVDSGIGGDILRRLRAAVSRVADVDEAYVINTHGHSDHSANSVIIEDLKKRFPRAHCYTHEGAIQDTEFFLKYVPLIGKPMQSGLAHTEWLLEADVRKFDFTSVRFQGWKAGGAFVLSTPGHSPDSVVVYVPGAHAMFTGDTLWYVSPNNPRGNIQQLLQSVADLKTLAESERINYLGEGHMAPVTGEKAVVKQISEFEANTRSLIAGIEKVIAGKQRITIQECLSRLGESTEPAVKRALAINFPRLPSYLDTFLNVLLREKGWQRVDRTDGGTWTSPGA